MRVKSDLTLSERSSLSYHNQGIAAKYIPGKAPEKKGRCHALITGKSLHFVVY